MRLLLDTDLERVSKCDDSFITRSEQWSCHRDIVTKSLLTSYSFPRLSSDWSKISRSEILDKSDVIGKKASYDVITCMIVQLFTLEFFNRTGLAVISVP